MSNAIDQSYIFLSIVYRFTIDFIYIFDAIMWDKAICINLDKRTDRWQQTQEECNRCGINVERFPALTGSNGMQGLHLSNQQIFRLYRGKQLLILEDDVIFSQPLSQLQEAYSDLPKEWDMLYLGGNPERPQFRYSTWLYRANGILTTHAILYSPKMTRWLAENMEVPEVVDRQNTIDVWYANEIQPKFNCFIAYPQIAGQRFGFSDICGMDINYKYFNKKSLKFFK